MKAILAPAQRPTLERLARRRLLIGLDFDGTLAPIVRRPERAALPAATRGLLRRLAARYPCVVISGRSRRDLGPRLRGLGLRGVIGNHGAEPSPRARELRARVRRWRAALARPLRALPGVTIEDKRLSLAVHYRGVARPERARAAVVAAAAALPGARLVGGKRVVNVIPSDAPDKGAALLAAARRLGCDASLYVGDDDTDEDAFALDGPAHVGVRVGRRRGSRAAYYLAGQADVARLLVRLTRLRGAASSRRGTPPGRTGSRRATTKAA